MSEREYELILKAIKYFMQDEPKNFEHSNYKLTDEEKKMLKEYEGWLGGMDILSRLVYSHRQRKQL